MAKNMIIHLSQYDRENDTRTIGQKVGFINIFNKALTSDAPPLKVKYEESGTDSACLIDYYDLELPERQYSIEEGYSPIKESDTSFSSVFRQEINIDNGEIVELTRLYPVDTQIAHFRFRDFNISNNRSYQYILYPFDRQDGLDDIDNFTIQKATQTVLNISWQGWSITELHPVDGENKKFTATPDDVWVFNLNVDTGEQSQNISRQEQQTLGQFNRYSQGRMNYVTGSVSCLLGSEVLPASYILKNGKTVNEGGYQEIRKNDKTPSSNQRVDMLLAWRKVVMSSNPKLLKDREGQSFLVTLSSATNKPMDAVRRQPNTISFTWTQIGNAEDVQIVDINA